ncbi:carboxylesterase/lipase family protein [Gryllotalpicola protaetiae]|uniref:Carboxylesterase/lipase family protein n=1 Tax=Gryllotalpicola protaetiae TaxID=2419771 RepID=A0A387BKN2_9MICO|nr:carboxylesterase family protein [Gryllotalpicola protaetiae]AYG02882.1 carboxylesterase/lipase family protein [Gryllotalpicola protaetiae]
MTTPPGPEPLLELRPGSVRGRRALTPYGAVDEFLGVRYAVAERFKPPCQPPRSSDVVEASNYGPACPQPPLAGKAPWTDEAECLNLNVWRPTSGAEGMPAMIWIHGGGFQFGSNAQPGTSGATLAARHGIAVVSLNYRLGVLGFLALDHLLGPEFQDSANLALLDIIAGIRWVRTHADALGIDTGNITVFGQSAGGAAVSTLLAMRSTEGLFRRAIIQSGTAERAQPLSEARARTAELLALLGLHDARADALLSMPVDELLRAQQELVAQRHLGRVGFQATIQPTIDGVWLEDLPFRCVKRGSHSATDVLVGTNLDEQTQVVPLDWSEERLAELPETLAQLVADDLGSEAQPDDYVKAVEAETGILPTGAQAMSAYLTDRHQRQPSNRLLDARRGSAGRTFSYLFTWRGSAGSTHSLEIPFVFDQLDHARLQSTLGGQPPQSLADEMSALWAAFARGEELQTARGESWRPYWPQRLTMVFDAPSHLESDPRGALRLFFRAQNVPRLA